jgi:hypothetical protein
MWMNRVIECPGAANIVLRTLNRSRKSQQFYLDAQSQTIISNQWKDRAITISSNGKGNNLSMARTTARWF